MITDLGDLTPVAINQIWATEAHAFTPWLAGQLPRLSDALGLGDLELLERESPVGGFRLDLLAKEVNTGRIVVIENQFGATDHDHLGKLLTYAAGKDAQVVIWVTEILRDEHREALEWLNRHTDEQTLFFGVQLEAIRIDQSRPAVRFIPVAMPNEWQRTARSRSSSNEISAKKEKYRVFFQSLLDELRDKHRFTTARTGQPQSWYSFSSGQRGIYFGASFAQGGRLRADLYIGSPDQQWNKAVFDALHKQRAAIDDVFGELLSWERLDHRVACRVAAYRPGDIESENDHPDMIAWFVDKLLKLKRLAAFITEAVAAVEDSQVA